MEGGEKAGASNKPGSVVDNHSSGTTVTGCLKQPTRESARNRRRGTHNLPDWGRCAFRYSPIWSCSGRGLPCRGLLPVARCALTAPFHPYRPKPAVYFLWHFPWVHTLQALPGALSEGARTFLCKLLLTAIAWPTPAFSDRGFYRKFPFREHPCDPACPARVLNYSGAPLLSSSKR